MKDTGIMQILGTSSLLSVFHQKLMHFFSENNSFAIEIDKTMGRERKEKKKKSLISENCFREKDWELPQIFRIYYVFYN